MNFHDFAGSTVVHSIGGWIALAGGIMLGPRLGRKFKRDGGGPMLPHDLTVGVIGGFLCIMGNAQYYIHRAAHGRVPSAPLSLSPSLFHSRSKSLSC
jgi:hypothetical protein